MGLLLDWAARWREERKRASWAGQQGGKRERKKEKREWAGLKRKRGRKRSAFKCI
jgi:hypothetical protein